MLKHFILSQLNMQRQLQYRVSKPFEKYKHFLCGTMKIPLFVLSELSYSWTVTWVGDGTVCSGGVFKKLFWKQLFAVLFSGIPFHYSLTETQDNAIYLYEKREWYERRESTIVPLSVSHMSGLIYSCYGQRGIFVWIKYSKGF